MDTTTSGLEAIQAKLTAIPLAIRKATGRANDKNADEFIAHVNAIIPREHGKLAATLEKRKGDVDEYAVLVSIGGDAAPYPAHLEWGHMTKTGHHVPAEPFWFPTLRVLRKRFRDRRTAAARYAIKVFQRG